MLTRGPFYRQAWKVSRVTAPSYSCGESLFGCGIMEPIEFESSLEEE